MTSERTADEIKHARAVREMFGGIAKRYDFLNHFLSINTDKRWRRLVRRKLAYILTDPGAVVLDVACGTGDLANELQHDSAAKVIGTDFCRPMLAIAAEKNEKNKTAIPYIEGDALALPFSSESFNAVTIAFGLRNLANFADGLAELRRVLKPGGRLAVLEFSAPVVPGFRQAFQFYFSHVLPRIGGAVSGSRGAYEYLPNSVSKFPDQKNLAEMMREVGFEGVEYQNLTGGIAAIHVGTRT
ncbi:MAG TPA: bifunctional demethylmenaquinone methyltransferase/2-methoxy-6-polyprenyl-1,4-benzoquinol methylase UbiE [Pyrinomonadaceae bacterium]|jgi:demethylmenaquinone methyltransferase/2-methoxy-6-polyprenyl-1,4-benzoquinol methylase|nr:bifunctional demethylmenaquinone methyltransferase/2-methoxy-6-polyprenyl-1,4-benzoquinol methylase UbiE [Pyrinomonadaceae bacterium]